MSEKCATSRFHQVLTLLFPFWRWLVSYNLDFLKKDLNAGFTVALVLIPQSMANAQLAGLPAYHGLYAALLPTIVGGLWGSSRQMVTSIGAVTALMASAALQPLVIDSPAGYVAHIALLTLLVGCIQLLFGVIRLGMLVNFLSLPVIHGFTNAAALIIVVSQLGKLLGITVDTNGSVYQNMAVLASSAWNYIHFPSLLMALLTVSILIACSKYIPKAPAVLIAIVFTTLLSWAGNFEETTTADVATIASDEARILLTRLSLQEKEIAGLQNDIALLREQEHSEDSVSALEVHYKIAEKELVRDHIVQNMNIVREHLRRLLFVAETKPDGTKIFHIKHSPKMAFFPPQAVIPSIQAAQPPTPGLNATTQPQPESIIIHESSLPADAFTDGNTWRLRLGSKAPDMQQLTFISGGAVVGSVASGLPTLQCPELSWKAIVQLLPSALIIAFICFAESISIGKAAATMRNYRLDANQELVGQGLANIAGSFSLTAPVAGSFSSSAVNLSAGGRTGIACAVAGGVTLIILLLFTGALAYLPQPVLAVIVVRAALGLFRLNHFITAWKAQRSDGIIALLTFLATLWFSPHLDYAIALGVVLSLAAFFFRSMTPNIAILSCGPDHALRDAQISHLEECRHIAIIQFQGPLFFANVAVLETMLLDKIEHDTDLRHIHLVCSAITSMDASGEDMLDSVVQRAYEAGIGMSFSGVVGAVTEMLQRTGLLELIGPEHIYLSPREAICAIHKQIQHDAGCTSCPLTGLICYTQQTEITGP